MKRQKRDRLERAQSQGYKAGETVDPMTNVPINRRKYALIG